MSESSGYAAIAALIAICIAAAYLIPKAITALFVAIGAAIACATFAMM